VVFLVATVIISLRTGESPETAQLSEVFAPL